MDLGLTGGLLVSPRETVRAHLYVAEGRIAAVTTQRLPARREVDVGGLHVLPGVVDGHVHFMDPGATDREDFMTGSAAAAVGGATTVIEHTHAFPVVDAGTLAEKVRHLRGRSLVDFGLGAHAWRGRLEDAAAAWAAGALFLKAFTCTTHGIPGLTNADVLRLFRLAAAHDAVCLVHCEDEALTAEAERALRAAGRTDGGVLPEWRSREAEIAAVAVVAALAERTGVRIAVAHASHPEVVDLAVQGRQRGARVFVETCPQYLYLREDEVREHGGFRKFTPPARQRSARDADEMWRRVADGAVSYVATDHAPATAAQKREGSIWDVHFGLPGVETTLSLLLHGVHEGRLTLGRVVELLAEAPARLYGLHPRKGTLQVGADADLVVVDLGRERVLRNEDVISKAGWTPYAGRRIVGQPVMTFVRGRLVAEAGRPAAEPGWGRWVSRPGVPGAA